MDRRHVVAAVSAAVAVFGFAGLSQATLNKCAAAKRICVAKHFAALATCRAKAAKPPGLTPEKLAACVQKAHDKFDGGAKPVKGCFAKLEAKLGASCLTTGDTATLAAKVNAFIAETDCDLDAATCLPQACIDVRTKAIGESGVAPANGSYTLYVGRNPNKPWTAYCHRMNLSQPTEYLSVDETDNFSQISNGTVVAQTSYRRLRIDPVTFVVDLLDDTFATTEDGGLTLPSGRSSVPAGWAQFGSAQSDDGPAAHAQIDLTGTGFALAESVLADELAFFCAVTAEGSPLPPTGGNSVEVANDLASFTLAALDPTGGSSTKVVADCTHLSVADDSLTTGTLPLQYVAP